MPERLTESLIRRGHLTQRQADEAHQRQVMMGGALDTSLLELELVDEGRLLESLSAAYGLATASPRHARADRDERALRAFPAQWADKHMLAPLELDADGATLTVLSPAPADVNLIVRLGDLLDLAIRPLLAPEFRVHERISFLYGIEPPARFATLIEEHGVASTSTPTTPPTPTTPAPFPPVGEPAKPATLSFGEAVSRLRDANDRDEIVRTTLLYAIRDLEHASVFINHEDHLEGWLGFGPGSDSVPQLRVELTPESAFRVVLDTRAHYLGPLPNDASHGDFLKKLGRPHPRAVLIIPIRIANRTVALLYGDNGGDPIAPRIAADLMLFTTHVQMALSELLLRRKAQSLSELPSESTSSPGVPLPSTPLVTPPDVESSQDDIDIVEDTGDLEGDWAEAASVGNGSSGNGAFGGAFAIPPAAPHVDAPAEPEDDSIDPYRANALETDSSPLLVPPPQDTVDIPDDQLDDDTIRVDRVVLDDAEDDRLPTVVTSTSGEPNPVVDARVEVPIEEPVELSGDIVPDWEPVDVDGLDALGAELDQTIAAAQAALEPPDSLGDGLLFADGETPLPDSAMADSLLEELDELEEALGTRSSPPEPALPIHNLAEITAQSAPDELPQQRHRSFAEEEDGWEAVDVDNAWDADQSEPDGAREAMRSSLVEDSTVPDLSAEAWLRASSEITRARPLAPEVMERAAMPDEPEPVPLTRITVGRTASPQEVVREINEADDHRREDDEPVPLTQLASDRLQMTPVDDDAPLLSDEEPVPLTKRSTSSAIPGTPNPFAYDEDVEVPLEDVAPDHVVDAMGRLVPIAEARIPVAPVVDPTTAVVTPEAAEIAKNLERIDDDDEAIRQDAIEALMRAGPDALPKLAERFPGPLSIDPFAPDATNLPPFAKCGPLLSILERHGRDAHSYVNRRLDAPDPLMRFFAIYFYGAVYVPEAIPRLIQRLHDEESRICMLGARTLFAYREHPDFAKVLDHLHGRLGATSIAARRHAAYLIGLFRDVTAIPKLIDILGQRDRGMVDVAEDALAEITKQRFSQNPKKWRAWWNKHGSKSRIAWLVEGLASKDALLRKSAAEELRAVTGLDMGFDADAPKRPREEARQRWASWWAEQTTPVNS